MKYLFAFTMVICAATGHAQIAGDVLFGGGIDVVKTDYETFAEKIQLGIEGNYYFSRDFTGSAGFELWMSDKASLAIGARWYPVEEAFVRMRALLGENDLNIGAGWTKPITSDLKFEAIGDFYFEGEFAIRVGLVYVLRKED